MATAAARRLLLPALRNSLSGARGVSTERAVGAAAVVGTHTAKWMQDTSKKSPMELINAVPRSRLKDELLLVMGVRIKVMKLLPLATQSSISALTWTSLLYASTVVFVLFKITITE